MGIWKKEVLNYAIYVGNKQRQNYFLLHCKWTHQPRRILISMSKIKGWSQGCWKNDGNATKRRGDGRLFQHLYCGQFGKKEIRDPLRASRANLQKFKMNFKQEVFVVHTDKRCFWCYKTICKKKELIRVQAVSCNTFGGGATLFWCCIPVDIWLKRLSFSKMKRKVAHFLKLTKKESNKQIEIEGVLEIERISKSLVSTYYLITTYNHICFRIYYSVLIQM